MSEPPDERPPTDDDDRARPGPGVTVVDGGLGRSQPRTPGSRPDLRLAPGPGADEGDVDPSAPEPAGPSTRVVRVIRGGWSRASDLARLGLMAVPAGGRQTLYRGSTARAYRLLCREGSLVVQVDGVRVESLEAGQTLDVEGAEIVALSAGPAPAHGHYVRL